MSFFFDCTFGSFGEGRGRENTESTVAAVRLISLSVNCNCVKSTIGSSREMTPLSSDVDEISPQRTDNNNSSVEIMEACSKESCDRSPSLGDSQTEVVCECQAAG